MDREKREPEKPKPKLKAAPSWRRFCPRFLEDAFYQKAAILIVFSLIVSFFLTPSFTSDTPSFQLGDIADRNVKADRDLLIEDEGATARKREEAVRGAPVIYELDENVANQVFERLESAFRLMREYSRDGEKPQAGSLLASGPLSEAAFPGGTDPSFELPDLLQQSLQRKRDFAGPLGVQIPDEIFTDLIEKKFSPDFQERVVQLLKTVFDQGIVSSKAWRLQDRGENLLIRKTGSKEEFLVPPPHSYLDIDEARKFAMMQAFERGGDPKEMRAMAFLASQLLQPNLTFNLDETERQREQAYSSVKPVFIQILKNEMLVREGQKIGPEELLKLKALDRGRPQRHLFLVFVTMFLFCSACTWVVVHVAKEHLPAYRMDTQDFLFLGGMMVFLLALGSSAFWLADNIGDGTSPICGKTLLYGVPITAGSMFASIFFGATAALIFSLLMTVFAGILFGRDFSIFLYFLISSFVAAHGVVRCRNRMIPIRAGLLVGCTNVILIVLVAFLQDQLMFLRTVANAFFGFCGGVFAGILVTGLTPIIEMLFGYSTDIKLLELATMDQPLLQELMVQAPGTYHHSIIVGNMVESAAKSIGANSLLAKVAAYYHDIGKIKKPLYFIENQFDCENRHEKLAPSMSSLILISHVKEGVELARQHHLGKDIINIISQHHGKSLISFFYKKAVEAREKQQSTKGAELPQVNIEDYRYPGPKPQTKEAGLVMLADVVEAACRSLTDPTPARIQGMVNRLINNVFSDGQLDECELTLKDLHQIARHFNQILATVHHKRIEYPAVSTNEGKVKIDGSDSGQRESRTDKDKPCTSREVVRTDLKRLGIH